MKIHLATDPRTGLYYRPWKTDLHTIRDVHKTMTYNMEDFKKTDIVVDIGCHIGSFSHRASPLVKQIYAFEPDFENFKIACLNNRENKNVTIFNAAIIENDDKERYLYESVARNSSSLSIYSPSRPHRVLVSCSNYESVIRKYEPTILKCDAEAAEYYFFQKPLYKSIRLFLTEFHFGKKRYKELYFQIMKSLLTEQGFQLTQETRLTSKSWNIEVNLWRTT